MSTNRKQTTCHASLGYIRQVLSENSESGLNVLHRVWIIRIFGERISSNTKNLFLLEPFPWCFFSHFGCLPFSLLSLKPHFVFFYYFPLLLTSPYLLGRIVPLCMRDCFNSQSKMRELISLPLILRDMSLPEKCKTVPVTVTVTILVYSPSPNPPFIIPDIEVWKFKGKKATESLKYLSFQCLEQSR